MSIFYAARKVKQGETGPDHKWQHGQIFVFGSNLQGKHGGGAASFAYQFCGALWGVGLGRTGAAYALPTMFDTGLPGSYHLTEIGATAFVQYAKEHPDLTFFLPEVGCGIAGLKPEIVSQYFKDVPSNVIIPPNWYQYLRKAENASQTQSQADGDSAPVRKAAHDERGWNPNTDTQLA